VQVVTDIGAESTTQPLPSAKIRNAELHFEKYMSRVMTGIYSQRPKLKSVLEQGLKMVALSKQENLIQNSRLEYTAARVSIAQYGTELSLLHAGE